MRRIRQAVAGVVSAVLVCAGLAVATFLIGGADCYSGECNFVGEAAGDDPLRWVVWPVYLAISAGAGFLVARAVR